MFKASDYILFSEIPTSWIFEQYLNLEEKLEGQTVFLNSIFNEKDKTPSFAIYYNDKTNKYYFKCFSTGRHGSAVDLVSYLYDISENDAILKIKEDYKNKEKIESSKIEFRRTKFSWKLHNYKIRSWRKKDIEYWTQYGVKKEVLEYYNVVPLAEYTLYNSKKQITIKNYLSYGFFCEKGLYKIYNPGGKRTKFVKILNYTQGLEQLEGSKHLVIAKSLKDIMSMRSQGLMLDMIAPDCENCMLNIINDLNTYDRKIVFFDSDPTGIKSMLKYRDTYGTNIVYYPAAKDFSDGFKYYGRDAFWDVIILMNKALNK